MEGECLPQKPGNWSNATTPDSMGTPSFNPSQEGKRTRNSRKSGITTQMSLLARGAWQPGLGEMPPPLQSPRVEGAAGMCLQPRARVALGLHPRLPHPAQGSLEEEPPQFLSFLTPKPSTLRAVAPAP